MSEYEQDIFYDVSNLTLEKKKQLLTECYHLNSNWWVDQLKGWSRERVDMGFSEILDLLKDDDHFVFIHRRGFKGPLPGEYTIETGFRTMSSPDLFLFIYVPLEHLMNLTTKYGLNKRL